MPIAQATLDHLVVAAATLEQGEDYIEAQLGVRPQRGGQHVAMGTHNSLLRLAMERVYLELIAIDPAGVAPGRPRWFALDSVESVAMPSLLKPVIATSKLSPFFTVRLPSASSRSFLGMTPSDLSP